MSVRYILQKNNLTGKKGLYTAAVRKKDTFDIERIADRIIAQGSLLNRSQIISFIESIEKVALSLLLDGFGVKLGSLVEFLPKIKGDFASLADNFEAHRHKADIAAIPGRSFRKAFAAKAEFERQQSQKPAPHLLQFTDVASGLTDTITTVGSIGSIKGHRLKFDKSVADEGIFFVPRNDLLPVVKVTTTQKNRPSELVFQIPSLCQSSLYILEVRSRLTSDGELRTGRLSSDLTIAASQSAVPSL